MSRVIYKFKISRIKDFGSQIRELELACIDPLEFRFQAGQFVMLHVPTESKPVLRAYSIASDDRIHNGFRLVLKYIQNGMASQFIWNLTGTEILSFTGPFGKLFFPTHPPKQLLMISTSTGLAPHISYLESKGEQFPDIQYRLLIGARTEADIFCTDILENLKNKLKNMSYEFILSQPSPTWQGKKGYVQNYIDEFTYLSTPSIFLLCGNKNMITEIKEHLAQHNFEKSNIISESFD
jgi:ferredoxin-NADP reductase